MSRVIEIDFDVLMDKGLTVSQYSLLFLLIEDTELLVKYVNKTSPFFKTELKDLVVRGYIVHPEFVNIDDVLIADLLPTFKAKAIFDKADDTVSINAADFFNTFWSEYPKYRGSNNAPLRIKKEWCETELKKYLKKYPNKGELIMYALERTKAAQAPNNYSYMKSTYQWIKDRVWTDYEDMYKKDSHNVQPIRQVQTSLYRGDE